MSLVVGCQSGNQVDAGGPAVSLTVVDDSEGGQCGILGQSVPSYAFVVGSQLAGRFERHPLSCDHYGCQSLIDPRVEVSNPGAWSATLNPSNSTIAMIAMAAGAAMITVSATGVTPAILQLRADDAARLAIVMPNALPTDPAPERLVIRRATMEALSPDIVLRPIDASGAMLCGELVVTHATTGNVRLAAASSNPQHLTNNRFRFSTTNVSGSASVRLTFGAMQTEYGVDIIDSTAATRIDARQYAMPTRILVRTFLGSNEAIGVTVHVSSLDPAALTFPRGPEADTPQPFIDVQPVTAGAAAEGTLRFSIPGSSAPPFDLLVRLPPS